MKNRLLLFFFFGFIAFLQAQKSDAFKLGFYNVENLYDTLNDPLTKDDEYTPMGEKEWNTDKYSWKLKQLSKAIGFMGEDLAVLGLAEVENRQVLLDLAATEGMAKKNWKIVHQDGPDARGVDVAFLYDENYFKVLSFSSFTLKIDDPNFLTRDQLLVSGLLKGKKVHFIVMHWPSRRGGQQDSEFKRIAGATLCTQITDSIRNADPKSGIVLMGDFNDDPKDVSVSQYLKTTTSLKDMPDESFFNPMETLHQQGLGTLAYRDQWNLFDQILMSASFVKEWKLKKCFEKAILFDDAFLRVREGKYKNYPYRTHAGNKYLGGYSDHFPVGIQLN